MDNYVVVTMEHWNFMIYAAEFYSVSIFDPQTLGNLPQMTRHFRYQCWSLPSCSNLVHIGCHVRTDAWDSHFSMYLLHGVLHACLVSFSLKLWTWIIRLYSTYICICIHVSMTQNHWWFQFLWKLSILWNHVPTGLLHLFSPKKRGGSGIITAWHNPRNP